MNSEEEWDEEEEGEGCDYLSEFCEHPDLRDLGCCFQCPIYLEALVEEEKERKKP